MDRYSLDKLPLLAAALKTIEVHHEAKGGLMTITREMRSVWGAGQLDLERFVDFPGYSAGVEAAALMREREQGSCRFSLRSNNSVNVADLARHFGGGGHPASAGFTGKGALESIKHEFLGMALLLLGTVNREL
jgi:phosphoesterase RecJ-like protein